MFAVDPGPQTRFDTNANGWTVVQMRGESTATQACSSTPGHRSLAFMSQRNSAG